MTRFVSLSSGSNGNCYYIGNEEHALLIDMGIGGRTVKKRLAALELDVDKIDLVLVTHDHMDHIKYLGGFTEKYLKPIFATEKLHTVLDNHFCTRGHLCGCVRNTIPGKEHEWRGIKFTPFSVPHDARDTVGYFIDFFGETFTFITDIGEVTDEAVAYCRKAKHLILESNYDLDMLLHGSYTPELKLRIMQGHGHLSNEQTASLIKRAYHIGVDSVFLCHLSENNNTPELARKSAEGALREAGAPSDILVKPLPRREASEIFTF
ncbi:MAG: MBL fold metallo-hydrolase [Bacteroidales bacterium]|nr:MBL fold metallo-hydrolase [Bacteroidales bacterium]